MSPDSVILGTHNWDAFHFGLFREMVSQDLTGNGQPQSVSPLSMSIVLVKGAIASNQRSGAPAARNGASTSGLKAATRGGRGAEPLAVFFLSAGMGLPCRSRG